VSIRELKATASAIVEDVRNRRVTWDALVVRLAEGAGESAGSAVEELERMRR
jgi:hypothetical protein